MASGHTDKKPYLLLINPWVTDFAAYDLWSKPLGLLYLADYLRTANFRIDLIDCMDRNHPATKSLMKSNWFKADGRGHYPKEILDKPDLLRKIPRRWGRYGLPLEAFKKELSQRPKPDAILFTSIMTYWYPGLFEAIRLVKEHWPQVPVIVGGIYATLFPEHARKYSGADKIITGYGEFSILRALSELGIRIPGVAPDPRTHFMSGSPAWDLYSKLDYLVILTSRGCPYSCSFCATKFLNPQFKQRPWEQVMDEIRRNQELFGYRHLVFYDDALFINRERHILPLLRALAKLQPPLQLHTPNGLFARFINQELAEALVAAGAETIRLSLETTDKKFLKKISNKVNENEFLRALKNLERAGYPRWKVETYLIVGLPGQTPQQVEEAIKFVHNVGARVRLAVFSPLPGTPEWEITRNTLNWPKDVDPLLTNNSIFPLANANFSWEDLQELKLLVNRGNHSLEQSI